LTLILVLGISLMVIAPLLRRYRMASPALAVGACIVLALAMIGLVFSGAARLGQAASHANRRFYLTTLACELPVLILALKSRKGFKWAFWLAWGINIAFAVFLTAVVVWLEFFWHW
jgi:hypothetical protein